MAEICHHGCKRDITAQEWKVNNREIEVIPLVVKASSKLSTVNVEITMRRRLQSPLFPLFQVHVDR